MITLNALTIFNFSRVLLVKFPSFLSTKCIIICLHYVSTISLQTINKRMTLLNASWYLFEVPCTRIAFYMLPFFSSPVPRSIHTTWAKVHEEMDGLETSIFILKTMKMIVSIFISFFFNRNVEYFSVNYLKLHIEYRNILSGYIWKSVETRSI